MSGQPETNLDRAFAAYDRWQDLVENVRDILDAVGVDPDAPAPPRTRDPYSIRDDDRWGVRDRRAVVAASNDWPAPSKGTHESDQDYPWPHVGYRYIGKTGVRGGLNEHDTARAWSRSQ